MLKVSSSSGMKLESMSALNTTLSVTESPRPIVPPLNVTLPVKVVAPPTLRSLVTSTVPVNVDRPDIIN